MPSQPAEKKLGRPTKSEIAQITRLQRKAVLVAVHKLGCNTWKSASPTKVAAAVGATRSAVSKWQRDPVVARLFDHLISLKQRELDRADSKRTAAGIVGRLKKKDAEKLALTNKFVQEVTRARNNNRKHIDAYVHKRWNGPTRSLDDTRMIETQSAYVEHILETSPELLSAEIFAEIFSGVMKPKA